MLNSGEFLDWYFSKLLYAFVIYDDIQGYVSLTNPKQLSKSDCLQSKIGHEKDYFLRHQLVLFDLTWRKLLDSSTDILSG